MHKTLFLSLFVLTLFSGCTKKKKNTSPNTSSEYFTCFVNGQEWVAQTPGGPNNPAAVSAEYSESFQALTISATWLSEDQSVFQDVKIRAYNLNGPGIYPMFTGNGSVIGFLDLNSNECEVYYYDSVYSATMTITELNFLTHHCKGTFECILSNRNCSDTLMFITGGQFSTYFQ